MMLEVSEIDVFYGVSHVLFEVSITVNQGEAVCILGRNGAGKTTLLRSILGLTPPQKGIIKFKGNDITHMPTFKVANLGIGYVPPDRRILGGLTVRENLELGARKGTGKYPIEEIYEFFPILKRLDNHLGAYLSGGEQQILAIGRALIRKPYILLLDEPTEGLSPLIVELIVEHIEKLKAQAVTILLAEMNVSFALTLCSRAYILEKGQVKYSGYVSELQGDKVLQEVLLAV